jgi:hypothetical protein
MKILHFIYIKGDTIFGFYLKITCCCVIFSCRFSFVIEGFDNLLPGVVVYKDSFSLINDCDSEPFFTTGNGGVVAKVSHPQKNDNSNHKDKRTDPNIEKRESNPDNTKNDSKNNGRFGRRFIRKFSVNENPPFSKKGMQSLVLNDWTCLTDNIKIKRQTTASTVLR